MRRVLLCLALALTFSAVLFAFADLRPPTAAEKQVLEKYENVINKTLDQFQSDDWDENVVIQIYGADDRIQELLRRLTGMR